MPANHSVSPRAPSPRFSLLKGEALAFAGMLGAALTVFAELSPALTVAPSLAYVIEHWRAVTEGVWRPLLDLIGLAIDPGLAAAIAIAWFMVMIAAGGRFAAQVAGQQCQTCAIATFGMARASRGGASSPSAPSALPF